MNLRGDRGFALLIVAIALAALSLIFAAALGTTRQHLSAAEAHLTRVRLSAALDGAITAAGYDLVTAREIEPAILVAPQEIAIGEDTVTVSARPEASKLDLNAANPDLLFRYLVASGIDEPRSKRIVEAILERRKDADPDYARKHDKDRAEPFESVFEIAALDSVDDDIAECIAPDLTVFTGLTGVDLDNASARVRVAAGAGTSGPPASPEAPRVATAGRAITAGEIFEVTARVRDEATDQNQSRQTIIRVTGNLRSPVWTLAITSPAPDEKPAQAACDRIQGNSRTASLIVK
jgi:type II secretory pathway component PulK